MKNDNNYLNIIKIFVSIWKTENIFTSKLYIKRYKSNYLTNQIFKLKDANKIFIKMKMKKKFRWNLSRKNLINLSLRLYQVLDSKYYDLKSKIIWNSNFHNKSLFNKNLIEYTLDIAKVQSVRKDIRFIYFLLNHFLKYKHISLNLYLKSNIIILKENIDYDESNEKILIEKNNLLNYFRFLLINILCKFSKINLDEFKIFTYFSKQKSKIDLTFTKLLRKKSIEIIYLSDKKNLKFALHSIYICSIEKNYTSNKIIIFPCSHLNSLSSIIFNHFIEKIIVNLHLNLIKCNYCQVYFHIFNLISLYFL